MSFPSVKNRGSLQSVSVVLLIAAGADPISETFPVPPFRIAQCTGERFSFVKLWSCTLLPRVHCTVTPSYLDLSRCPPPVGWFKNSSHVTNEEAGWCTYMYWLVVWNIFVFPYIGNTNPNWLIFFRGVETTNRWLKQCFLPVTTYMYFWQRHHWYQALKFQQKSGVTEFRPGVWPFEIQHYSTWFCWRNR